MAAAPPLSLAVIGSSTACRETAGTAGWVAVPAGGRTHALQGRACSMVGRTHHSVEAHADAQLGGIEVEAMVVELHCKCRLLGRRAEREQGPHRLQGFAGRQAGG